MIKDIDVDTVIKKSAINIINERKIFINVYKIALEYCNIYDKYIRVSNTEWILSHDMVYPNIINIYARNPLKVANTIANKLYETVTDVIYLKTQIPFREFEISVATRSMIKIYKDTMIKGDIVTTVMGHKIRLMSSHVELINIFHILYSPFPDQWDIASLLMNKLLIIDEKDTDVSTNINTDTNIEDKHEDKHDKGHKRGGNDGKIFKFKKICYDNLHNSDMGILIGKWACAKIYDLHKEEWKRYVSIYPLQLISSLSISVMKEKINNLLREYKYQLTSTEETVDIPYDYWLTKTTYLIDGNILFEIYNSTTYELVPYTISNVILGHPYVIARFLAIDNIHGWTYDVNRLITDVIIPNQYMGVYKNMMVEKRKLIKEQEVKFAPYIPMQYEHKFHRLRTFDDKKIHTGGNNLGWINHGDGENDEDDPVYTGGGRDETDDHWEYTHVDKFIADNKKGKIGFPYKRLFYSDEEIYDKFDKLRKYDYNTRLTKIDKSYIIRQLRMKQSMTYCGRYTILKNNDQDYEDFNLLSDMFQEYNRMRCRFTTNQSPLNVYESKLQFFAQECISAHKSINPKDMRHTIYLHTKECTSFRPSNLVAMIQMFKATNVLDFSSGWGDRLIAAMATGVKYTGVDPNTVLHPKYNEMIEFFSHATPPIDKSKYTMVCSPFEDYKITDKYDLVFTSPPYFDMEKYSDQDTQSIVKYRNVNSWFDNFLVVSVKKAASCLVEDGHMVIVISQDHKHDYVTRLIDYIHNRIHGLKYLGVISYSFIKDNYPVSAQPMFVWKKCVHIPIELYSPPIEIIQYTVESTNKTFKVNVIRDDYLIGGTKQRSMIPLLEEIKEETIIFSGSVYGCAQVAFGYATYLTHKKGIIYVESNKRNTLTSKALSYGIRMTSCKGLSDARKRASDYYKHNKSNSYLLELGGNNDRFKEILVQNIKAAWPHTIDENDDIDTKYMQDIDIKGGKPKDSKDSKDTQPKVIWLVAGSGIIMETLYNVFPYTYFNVVQVGRTIWEDQIDKKRTTIYVSNEKYQDVAIHQPPYPTVNTYDAKLWKYVLDHGNDGDYIWNVSSM